MIAMTIYKDRSNLLALGIKADGVLVDISSITRATLQVGENLFDSALHSGVFDWTTNGATGQLDVDIARLNRVRKGNFTAQLVIYDATYPNGLVWDDFKVFIK